ncbi:MAG: crotonase/enoyl-CoA hydratase family protein [Pseudomonadota bacterium]
MALSTQDFQAMLAEGNNDNLPGRMSNTTARSLVRIVRRDADLNFDLPNLKVRLEPENGILWAIMKHPERACYTPETMADLRELQLHLRRSFHGVDANDMPFRYLVWASEAPKAWSLGGDLLNFTSMIRSGDRDGLRDYAHLAIDILHDNYVALDLPIVTMALIQGDAIGGGFEAMLTDDVVIAEEGAKFGLPEILFNLFPGMGAYSFLKRKLGETMARRLIEDGKTRSAAEAAELGLVNQVCPTGGGEQALRDYISSQRTKWRTTLTLQQTQRRIDRISKRELLDVVDMWVDLAMELDPSDLRRMDCLARVQTRKAVPTRQLQAV